jgi:hypothetical protein
LTARLEGAGVSAPFALTAKPSRERYEGVLDTDGLALDPARSYRLRVLAGELELGYADVRVFTKNKEAKSLASDEYFELVDGKKLKIEVYVNLCAVVTCDGATQCRAAATCDGVTGMCVPGDPLPCAGTLEVSAGVDETAATAARLQLDAQVSVEEATVFPAAPASLASYWPAAGTTALATFSGDVGAWSLRSSGRACAPLALAQAQVSGDAALADLVEESRGAADLCAFSVSGRHYLEVSLSRDGAARTPALAAPARPSHHFESRFRAELGAPIFDGGTLRLGDLDGAHGPLPLGGQLVVDETGGAPWYGASLGGTVSFTFTPTAN